MYFPAAPTGWEGEDRGYVTESQEWENAGCEKKRRKTAPGLFRLMLHQRPTRLGSRLLNITPRMIISCLRSLWLAALLLLPRAICTRRQASAHCGGPLKSMGLAGGCLNYPAPKFMRVPCPYPTFFIYLIYIFFFLSPKVRVKPKLPSDFEMYFRKITHLLPRSEGLFLYKFCIIETRVRTSRAKTGVNLFFQKKKYDPQITSMHEI